MLFKTNPYFSQFFLEQDKIPFSNQEIIDLDQELSFYEKKFLNPDIESNLISKNELFTSFAISKAEDSNLTLPQAKSIYKLIKNNKEWTLISKKINQNQPLLQTDHDKLEYYNILTTFRYLNQHPFTLDELNLELLKNTHAKLTAGMDVFANHLFGFEQYYSGKLRANDQIQVGDYQPSPAKDLPKNTQELINWLKNDFTIHNIAIFHNALYALHPFNNGNKRLCRTIEHLLYRLIGLNHKNTYSTSYHYHQFKSQYYKRLMSSLLKKDLTIFASFIIEAIAISILGVYKTSIEFARQQFLAENANGDKQELILKPLIKEKKVIYTNLYKRVKRKMSEQSFSTELQKATQAGWLAKQKQGRQVFYSLNLELAEEDLFRTKAEYIKNKIGQLPVEYRNT